jgi:hypothetical protein
MIAIGGIAGSVIHALKQNDIHARHRSAAIAGLITIPRVCVTVPLAQTTPQFSRA